jgi:hypothetical protein
MDPAKEMHMKLLIAIAAAAGLSGCMAYGGGTYGTADVYYGNTTAYPAYPAYGYGGGYYGGGVVVQPQPEYRGAQSGRGYRDRDRDGVPNRYDRDRDGDGVPNRRDSAPNNPRRN